MFHMKKVKLKQWILLITSAFVLFFFFGLHIRIKEKDFYTQFSYPVVGDVSSYAENMKKGEEPLVKPVYNHDYTFYKTPNAKCLSQDASQYEKLRVLYLVKSALPHFERRSAIRKTWGFEGRFSDVPIRTVFLLGSDPGDDESIQTQVEEEDRKYNDLVQGDFLDTYYNNSIKTMMGLRWGVEHCPEARFYMFVDDDYYVSTRNLLRFLRNPVDYPQYLQEDVISFDANEISDKKQTRGFSRHLSGFAELEKSERSGRSRRSDKLVDNIYSENGTETRRITRKLNQLVDFDLPDDVRLYTGFVFDSPRPLRHMTSKWFVDFEEYPFHRWPPYVTAGSYVLSREALVDMYYTSYFTKLFRFDDIYLGLIAKKAEIEPFHAEEFHFYPAPYHVQGYKYVVSSHGYDDPNKLVKVWNQQKQAGNA